MCCQPVLVQSQQTAAAPQLGRRLCPRPTRYLLVRHSPIDFMAILMIRLSQGESVGAVKLLVPEGSNNQLVSVCCSLFPHHASHRRKYF